MLHTLDDAKGGFVVNTIVYPYPWVWTMFIAIVGCAVSAWMGSGFPAVCLMCVWVVYLWKWPHQVRITCVEYNGVLVERWNVFWWRLERQFFVFDMIDDVVINECVQGMSIVFVLLLMVTNKDTSSTSKVVLLLEGLKLEQFKSVRTRMKQLLHHP
jgi:hypothetical protein